MFVLVANSGYRWFPLVLELPLLSDFFCERENSEKNRRIFYAVHERIVYYAGFKSLIIEYVFTINCLFICSYYLFEPQLVMFPLKVVY